MKDFENMTYKNNAFSAKQMLKNSKMDLEMLNSPIVEDAQEINNDDMIDIDSYAADDKMRKFQLAMAYVPWQKFENIYPGGVAMTRGTMFKDLDFPLLREEVTPRE